MTETELELVMDTCEQPDCKVCQISLATIEQLMKGET